MSTQYEMVINHLGFTQVVDMKGEHRCPNCGVEYTNEGEGILCKTCGDEDEQ